MLLVYFLESDCIKLEGSYKIVQRISLQVVNVLAVCMYIWFMLGHGVVTGEMSVYICICDETWKYYEETSSRAFLQD